MDRAGALLERSATRRLATADDREFLFRVFASTREEELGGVPWDAESKLAFLRQQFEAQDAHYRRYYPTAAFEVVLLGDEPIGRLYVDRWESEIRIMDISLMPAYRNEGIGTALLGELLDEGRRRGKTVSIHVEIYNPAMRLYQRLGFVHREDRGVYALMEWTPKSAAGGTADGGEG